MRSYERPLISWTVVFLLLLAPAPASAGLELPAFEEEDRIRIVRHTAYTLQYCEEFEQARWAAYVLRPHMISGAVSRTNDFRPDPLVKTGSASPEDYRGSGFDRGHLVPAADMKFSRKCMSETFYMSNMSPQRPAFNRGIWKELENLVRRWVRRDGELLIVTGPVLSGESLSVIGQNRVAVPDFFYKVILDYREPEIKAIAFVLPNEKAGEDLSAFAVCVDRVEELTGIDFYAGLPDDVEERLESSLELDRWWFSGRPFPGTGPSPVEGEDLPIEGAFLERCREIQEEIVLAVHIRRPGQIEQSQGMGLIARIDQIDHFLSDLRGRDSG